MKQKTIAPAFTYPSKNLRLLIRHKLTMGYPLTLGSAPAQDGPGLPRSRHRRLGQACSPARDARRCAPLVRICVEPVARGDCRKGRGESGADQPRHQKGNRQGAERPQDFRLLFSVLLFPCQFANLPACSAEEV